MIFILCNTLCVLNKTKDINIIAFKTITGFNYGIYNSRVAKSSYKAELRIMTSQTELLTLKFHYFENFGVSNSKCDRNLNIVLEVTRDF